MSKRLTIEEFIKTLKSGSGSSEGGGLKPLIVDVSYTEDSGETVFLQLDHTWQEIYDAGFCVARGVAETGASIVPIACACMLNMMDGDSPLPPSYTVTLPSVFVRTWEIDLDAPYVYFDTSAADDFPRCSIISVGSVYQAASAV